MQKELPIGIDSLNQIHHTADIHIRNVSRHDEYRKVFERFYDRIDRNKTEDDIIFVGGDIAHSKNDMSPELVSLASEFLRELSSRLPTIVIPGNHDHLASNPNRLDAISPVTDNLVDSSNLFYLKQSGVWTFGDTALVHFSQYDDPEDYPRAEDVEGDFENVIAMYHGTVDKSMTDTGFALDSDVNLETFSGFDISLLGDIHRFQYMDLSETVAFPGSLIQQNHGEDLKHGFLLWDVPSRDAEFITVPNEYGYYTLDVKNGGVPLDASVPEKVRLRLKVEGTSPAELNRVTSDVRQLYNVQELRYDRQSQKTSTARDDSSSEIKIGDIQSTSYQSKLIEEYLGREYDLSDDMVRRVKQLNKEVNNKVESGELRRNAQWRLKRFEWSNMFSYGEGNEIDFEKMGGIVGLFAENAAGKSSLLDAISFCLFDKCSRAYKSTDILNNQSEWFRCKAVFELDGTDYVIERTAEFESDGRLPVEVDFYKVVAGEKVSLNGERRSKTNKKIRRYIGEYEDFVLTAFSMQNNNNSMFVEKSHAERKDLLTRFIGIDVFERLRSKAKDEFRDVSALLDNYESRDITEEFADAKKRLEKAQSEYAELKSKREDLQDRKSELESKIMSYHQQLVDTDEPDVDIEQLRSTRDRLQQKLEEATDARKALEIKKREKQQPLHGFKDMVADLDEDELRREKEAFEDMRDKAGRARDRVDSLEAKISDLDSEIEHVRGHEFDPDCEYCVKRNERDAQRLERLENEREDAQKRLEKLRDNILPRLAAKIEDESKGKDPVEAWEKFQRIQNRMRELKSEIQGFEMKAREKQVEENQIRNELDSTESKIKRYRSAKEDIEHNREVREKMEPAKDKLQDVRSKIDRISSDIQDRFSDIKVAERDKQKASEDLKEYRQLKEDSEAYDLYLEATKRDGVPYDIIEDVMPQIEQEVNEILGQIVPFGIMMHLDGKNVNAHIIYDEKRYWPVELASGMEKFVSSLAIRVALVNISNMPRPDFLAIDEGFGVLDQSNLNSLSLLFDYLKAQFKFCVVISHLEVMRDMVNDLIEIEERDEKSHVTYL
jgi:DNA repair exonuclease SbcCD ATPase subunit